MSTDTPDATPSPQSSNNGSSSDDVVRIPASHDADGVSSAQTVITPQSDTRCKEVHCDPRPRIPVIFLPGVMGSLLCDKDSGAALWAPPNMDSVASAVPGVASVITGYFQSAAKREIRFDPTQAVVDPSGAVVKLPKDIGFDQDEARRRGWSTVHRWSYQHMLVWLQDMLDNAMNYGDLHDVWARGDPKGKDFTFNPMFDASPSAYGAYGAKGPLTKDSEVFKSFLRYRYPVYAIGYNFLQSTQTSGKQVLEGIDVTNQKTKKVTRIMGIREICRECNTDKAIIITHSMGGLVARMACQFNDGAKDMLGVIHGAQPATGAPLFAKRFRTGGEGNSFKDRLTNKSLLGRNDAEFVAIAANAEGPMELSPMPDYNNGNPWWIFTNKSGKTCMALPKASALNELYINDKWYGLVPNGSLLDPAKIVKKRLDQEGGNISVGENYKRTIKNVVGRQKQLINKYHPNTYALYGKGALKPCDSDGTQPSPKLEASLPDEALETWGNVVWRIDTADEVNEADLQAATLLHDDHHGQLTILLKGQTVKVTVQQRNIAAKPDEKVDDVMDNGIILGDGTVPAWSADAQGRGLVPEVSTTVGTAKGVQMVFVQGGYEHQFCFGHPWTRWGLLYSVAHIVHGKKGQAA
jgi:hypothetical protein